MKPVRIGCSGWVYKDWRGDLYPEGLPQRRWLERYAEVFDTVEINNTFYRLPGLDAVKRWAEETPGGFTFAVKGSRYTTHIKRLIDFPKYTERFFERIEPLAEAGKLGPVLCSSPGTSGGTTSGSRAPWRGFAGARGGTRSSSAIPPGSPRTCTRCSASTTPRS
jgi:uncharacterized protein YecE (DUF72 family)